MTSRCLHKSSPTLPQGQRPDPIPAWGNAPGNVSQIKMRAERPSQPAFTRGFESGFQPSGLHRGLFLGRWPRLVCRRAVGAPAASSAMTSRRLHKSSPTLPQGQRPNPIPAWGNAPGHASQGKMRAEGLIQPAFTRGSGSGFQPSGLHRGLFLGRWPRLVCRRAVGAPAAETECGWAMAGSRLRWPPARPAAAGRRHNLPTPHWPVEMIP